jgi:hypothetical protein
LPELQNVLDYLEGVMYIVSMEAIPMSKVTGFIEGTTSSGFGKWYAAILDCKHWYYEPNNYGPISSNILVGTEIECKTCAQHAEAVARLEALDLSDIQYLRFNTRWAYPDQGIHGQYLAYRRDRTSPTGVIFADSFPAIAAIDAVINRRRICAISPTEGRER